MAICFILNQNSQCLAIFQGQVESLVVWLLNSLVEFRAQQNFLGIVSGEQAKTVKIQK